MAFRDISMETFRSRLSDATTRTSDMELLMNTTAKSSVESTLTALEVAVGAKLFKVALYLHGNYDGSQQDATVTKDIVLQTTEAFNTAARLADAAYKEMGKIHVQITDFKAGTIRQLLDDLKYSSEKLAKSMEDEQDEVRNLADQIVENARERAGAEALCEKLAILDSPLMEFGVCITGGLGWLAGLAKIGGDDGNDRGEDPLEMLQQARSALSDLRIHATTLQRQLTEAQKRSMTLTMEYDANSNMQREIQPLVQSIENLYAQGNSMVQITLQLKNRIVQLCRLAADLKQYAEIEVGGARKKSDFTAGILDICVAALIEPRLADEIQMVADELMKGYEGAALTKDNQSKMDQVHQEVKLLLTH
ncbi:hypothetical protein GGI43DRAFT_432485 [Trichoderma evansii]